MTFDIHPNAQPYYERMDLALALAVARETVDEWDYAEDPHGYCHERPVLVRLIEAVEAANDDAE